MQTNIGIHDRHRSQIANELSKLVADEYILYTKTRNAHWNVVGPDFSAMHAFFESQYDQLDEIIDDVAERVRSLGHRAPGSLAEFLELTQLRESPRTTRTSLDFIEELLADHEAIIRTQRPNIERFEAELGDAGTSDFITALVEQHEKMAWMLRAHLVE